MKGNLCLMLVLVCSQCSSENTSRLQAQNTPSLFSGFPNNANGFKSRSDVHHGGPEHTTDHDLKDKKGENVNYAYPITRDPPLPFYLIDPVRKVLPYALLGYNLAILGILLTPIINDKNQNVNNLLQGKTEDPAEGRENTEPDQLEGTLNEALQAGDDGQFGIANEAPPAEDFVSSVNF